jgi:hypothetical protein
VKTQIKRHVTAVVLGLAASAIMVAPALARPAASFYTPQQLKAMSANWAAKERLLGDRPAASFYTPQQLEAMSSNWAAKGRLLGGRRAASHLRTGGKVKVRITFKNNGQDVSDGGVAGTGHFTASGAITDKGTVVIYRTKKGALITLRNVCVGKKGGITFVVKIDTILGTSRWTIASGTKAYKGLHGKGTERENPPKYTVSTLTGSVSR